MEDNVNLTDKVVDIVAAFVSKNAIPAAELPALITSVHASLTSLAGGDNAKPAEPQVPAVSVKKSVGSDYIICLEDGRKFKSLKRHLRTKYSMSPEDYRAKWGLPKDYPMVAPAYAAARSNLAKRMGLGQGGRKPAAEAPKTRGRKAVSA
ncbi:MAG TPA: MucR family transcriptional regulator [Asticcacaulis sp.]|nr:MucR family transcriptional regulator [Asticcacaulis sp.]